MRREYIVRSRGWDPSLLELSEESRLVREETGIASSSARSISWSAAFIVQSISGGNQQAGIMRDKIFFCQTQLICIQAREVETPMLNSEPTTSSALQVGTVCIVLFF